MVTPQTRHNANTAHRSMPVVGMLIASLLASTVAGCGGRLEATAMPSVAITAGVEPVARAWVTDHPTFEPTEADTPARHAPWHGVLLAGVPGTNAYSALQSQVDEIADPAASGRLRWRAVIEPIATVGQVNAALTAAGARIVSMQPGHTELVLEMVAQDHSAAAKFAEAHLIASRAFASIHTAGSLRVHLPTPLAQVQDVDPSLPALVEDTASPP